MAMTFVLLAAIAVLVGVALIMIAFGDRSRHGDRSLHVTFWDGGDRDGDGGGCDGD